jgi:16S rRNA (uracil1498-N3)-methyltransferase
VRLTRVYVQRELLPGTQIELPADAASHLAKVLRVRGGEELILFSGDGREFLGTIEAVRGARVTASIGAAAAVDRESPLLVTLLQCLPRGDRMDLIVHKATELGAARIQPVLSQRSVVRLDAAQAQAKATHWRAVAASACEQCGRTRLPLIETPTALLTYLGKAAPPGTRLVLEPGAESNIAPESLETAVEIAIGPEGGFADEELEALRIAGFSRIRLGPRILRTETAAIAALAWAQTRYGDL